MLYDFLFQIWKRLSARLQWWILWLFNSKFMVSVSGVVLDGENKILLQRHRHWVYDVWGLPGGIVQSGEKLEDAFAREVLEETGLEISEIELLKVVSGYRLRLDAYFKSRLDPERGVQGMKLQGQEVLDARFFSLDDLPEKMLPEQKEIVRIAGL
jgi:ADP-ribose pyrophosphatase YjhB (NUDIX family)